MWLAKDKSGALCLYNRKPVQNEDGNWFIKEDNGIGDNPEYDYLQLVDGQFPALSWNDNPIQVKIILDNVYFPLKKQLDLLEEHLFE